MISLAATALLVTMAAAPAPQQLALAWYADYFGRAELVENTLELETLPRFAGLAPQEREKVVATLLGLWQQTAPGPRLVELHGAEGGAVYSEPEPGRRTLAASWGAFAPPSSGIAALRTEGRWFANASVFATTGPGITLAGRVGTFLWGGLYDVSAGVNAGVTLSGLTPATLLLTGRRSFLFERWPSVSPNAGLQAQVSASIDQGFTFDAGLVAGVALRPGQAPGMIEVSLFLSLQTAQLSFGYTVVF